MVMRAEKAFRTGEIYFGADRSVFGPAFDAQYALVCREMAFKRDPGKTLKAHADRLIKNLGQEVKQKTHSSMR